MNIWTNKIEPLNTNKIKKTILSIQLVYSEKPKSINSIAVYLSVKKMPKSYITGASTKRTTDLKTPTKSDGTKDQRYSSVQFVKKDGTRDMRTTLTGNR